jgi:hypothetical protein
MHFAAEQMYREVAVRSRFGILAVVGIDLIQRRIPLMPGVSAASRWTCQAWMK